MASSKFRPLEPESDTHPEGGRMTPITDMEVLEKKKVGPVWSEVNRVVFQGRNSAFGSKGYCYSYNYSR